ncbi:tRNA-guanine(15) transglycosylase-like protein [Haematococcus lacustris]
MLAQATFSIGSTDGAARTGSLSTAHGQISTPASLVYTRRGGCMSLTPDIISRLQPAPQGMQVSVLQFLAHPSPQSLARYGQGVHAYLAVANTMPILASNRDPTMYEYGAKPSTDAGAYATIHCGGVLVTPEKYMEAVAALQPDLYVTLCDEVTPDASKKRLTASRERTLKWLDACLEGGQGGQAHCAALAAVTGGISPQERTLSAQAAAQRDVLGFALCGFGVGESPAQRAAAMGALLPELPASKLRFMSGMSTPSDVVEAVEQGVDLFDTSFVNAATQGGYALVFPLQPLQGALVEPADVTGGRDATKLNLWAPAHRASKAAVLPGCSCYTCKHHTRAYLHHLLQVNEMLADVLLDIHNTHHFEAWMAAIRAAIAAGTFTAYAAWFRSLLSSNSGNQDHTEAPMVEAGRRFESKQRKDRAAGEEQPPAKRPNTQVASA